MAELHGRVSRLPDRGLSAMTRALASVVAVVAVLLALGVAASARAQLVAHTAPTPAELEGWVRQLGAESAEQRAAAFAALTTLDEDALPAIDARIAVLARRQLDAEQAGKTLTAIRHAAGSRRADDNVDIAPGVLVLLGERRDDIVARIAEPLLLMRSLERMATVDSIGRIGVLAGLDRGIWMPEGRRAIVRLGPRAIPALIESKLAESPAARTWGRWGLRQLTVSTPGMIVQGRDSALLSEILRAWGKVLDFDAMRVVISYVGNERTEVRDAARWTMERYGRNAVWQLRQAYRNFTGAEAAPGLGWRKLMEALFRAYDDARLVEVSAWLDQGLAAARAGDLGTMRERFDRVLLRAPHHERRAEMAPGYAALASARLERDDLAGAAAAFARAVRLAPAHTEARAWRAQLEYIEGERSLARGIVDLESYRRALALAPGDARAADVLETLTGERAAHEARLRTWLSLAAALALAILGVLPLRRRRPDASPDAPSTVADATVPGNSEATLTGA